MSQTTFSNGIGYEGKVTLTLKSNNHILKTKTYKNSGTIQLFRFLGFCLADSFEEAKRLLPAKILLLYNNSASIAVADPRNVEQCSTFRTRLHTPTIISENTTESTNGVNTSKVRVIYNFEIPCSEIAQNFNQIALYGAGVNDIQDFSAYYYLVGATGEFDEQHIANWSTTTVLLIDWELTISNKNTDTRSEEEL